MMIGEPHAPTNPERKGAPSSEMRLAVSGLAHRRRMAAGRASSIDCLNVHAHEIVGIAGVSGNGQKDLVEVLGGQRPFECGHDPGGRRALRRQPRGKSQARDVRVLPEEPLRNGCVPPMTVVDNLNLRGFDLGAAASAPLLAGSRRHGGTRADMIAAYGIRTPSPQAPIGVLSGGNVQRCVLARELDGDVRLLIVANPCFGLDVKAVAETRARIMAARNAGTAVLLISEDLDEILELADRIVVMHDGQVAARNAGGGSRSAGDRPPHAGSPLTLTT